MDEAVLSLVKVNKSFGKTAIITDLSIRVNKGEFITLLGPSGCGKTTTLRLISGLETQDSGTILLNGVDISHLEPNHRNVNTVFQNYALFPHLNVFDNISYGLRIKRTDKQEIKKRVNEMLALVRMEGFEHRMPNQLSGGQRQRVAIARSLINKPDILLLDEPLGALDLKLRQHMQTELKRIQKHTCITFVYVTHDQDEALNLSNRIAIMNNGHFEQIDTPREIYARPKTLFVAEFVGERNIFNGEVMEITATHAIVRLSGQLVFCRKDGLRVGDNVTLTVHTDKMLISPEPFQGFCLKVNMIETQYTGSQRTLHVITETGDRLKVLQYNPPDASDAQTTFFVSWAVDDGVVIVR